jgi:O-antigen/teichoic acid export membrane protein
MRRDLATAYLAAAAKVGSWAVVFALAYRLLTPGEVAILVLARSTLGLLNYASFGLAPAMVRGLAEALNTPNRVLPIMEVPGHAIAYATPATLDPEDGGRAVRRLYFSGHVIGFTSCLVAATLAVVAVFVFDDIGWIGTRDARLGQVILVLSMGVGTGLRLMSDAASAVLQTHGRIAVDNRLLIITELIWVAGVALAAFVASPPSHPFSLGAIGLPFVVASAFLLFARNWAANGAVKLDFGNHGLFHLPTARALVASGLVLTFAQLADFLYAPTDFVLIAHLLGPTDVAAYAPLVQIDAALLLLVTGLAGVLLPRAAVAHAGGDVAAVRAYFVRGTLASLGMLTVAAAVVWAASPWLFTVWLGDDLPASRAILPLLLVHTVMGGSSAVGRSMLLGMGRVKPFAVAALLAGVGNVVLSYCFVKYLGLGLNGIVLGTIVAVVGRCVIWQPWYVMRCLGTAARLG